MNETQPAHIPPYAREIEMLARFEARVRDSARVSAARRFYCETLLAAGRTLFSNGMPGYSESESAEARAFFERMLAERPLFVRFLNESASVLAESYEFPLDEVSARNVRIDARYFFWQATNPESYYASYFASLDADKPR